MAYAKDLHKLEGKDRKKFKKLEKQLEEYYTCPCCGNNTDFNPEADGEQCSACGYPNPDGRF